MEEEEEEEEEKEFEKIFKIPKMIFNVNTSNFFNFIVATGLIFRRGG